eukprot:scaffold6776_cov42-Phaeocystis_antarctica.AAC.1
MTPQSRPETSDLRVRKTIMSRARRPPAVAPSHFKSPTAACRRPRRSYPSYHVLWPPAIVQIFFRKSILASCGGCPRRNGMHGTPEDFTSRGACKAAPYSTNTDSTTPVCVLLLCSALTLAWPSMCVC